MIKYMGQAFLSPLKTESDVLLDNKITGTTTAPSGNFPCMSESVPLMNSNKSRRKWKSIRECGVLEDRLPMISRGAEGQRKAEVTKKEQRSSWEVFNVIFKLRSCPLSV